MSKALFLDRDGVINERIIGGYVTKFSNFHFLEGVLEAIKILSQHFDHLFIVTNQQGIGKGLFTESDLHNIHAAMSATIKEHGGRIDAIYFAPFLHAENHPFRKPSIGMALQAKKDFPAIHLANAIMVGDSISDLEFGKNAGMETVYISEEAKQHPLADWQYGSLLEFAHAQSNK